MSPEPTQLKDSDAITTDPFAKPIPGTAALKLQDGFELAPRDVTFTSNDACYFYENHIRYHAQRRKPEDDELTILYAVPVPGSKLLAADIAAAQPKP